MDNGSDAMAAFAFLPFMALYPAIFCFQGFIWILAILGLVLWILMLVDVIQRDVKDFPNQTENDRLVWILVVALTSWVGALIYYLVVYRKMGKAT